MSGTHSHSRHPKARTKASRPNLARQLRIVLVVTVVVGVVAAVMASWDQLFPIPPERLVKIYRLHGCRCAFNFAEALERKGFVVQVYEYETLKYVRTSLHTPTNLHGCHVGSYLGYFLEGHVAPDALDQLARQDPSALGVATEGSVREKSTHVQIEREQQSAVLLVQRDGRAQAWFDPSGGPKG